ncbi:SH2 domain protein [Cooperia oncophora]
MEDDTGGTGGSIGGLGYWKQNLYLLQERAPKPLAVKCNRVIENRPPQYGSEFHGLIDRVEADRMLMEAGEGAFLVRESKRSQDAFTLCMLFDGRVLNYKLYYDGTHYVGEKRFETMELLVADGLISMFMDKHASDYIKRMADEAIYEHSGIFKGVRCEDCGFAAHKRCSEHTLPDCRPEARYVKRMFAVDLTTLCLAHSTPIPPVVTKCIYEVEARGLNVEGIYRVSGSHEHMEKLKRQFDSQQSVDLNQVDDIHTVCGLLKGL